MAVQNFAKIHFPYGLFTHAYNIFCDMMNEKRDMFIFLLFQWMALKRTYICFLYTRYIYLLLVHYFSFVEKGLFLKGGKSKVIKSTTQSSGIFLDSQTSNECLCKSSHHSLNKFTTIWRVYINKSKKVAKIWR